MLAKPSRREILAGVAAAAVATALPVIPLLEPGSGSWWDDAELEAWRSVFAKHPLATAGELLADKLEASAIAGWDDAMKSRRR